jgi:hypothetical protein
MRLLLVFLYDASEMLYLFLYFIFESPAWRTLNCLVLQTVYGVFYFNFHRTLQDMR